MRFLPGEHALGELGAAGEAVGEIQRLRNHDARIAVGPIGGRGALKGNAETELERGEIVGGSAFVVELQTVRICRERMQALATGRA